MLLIKFGGSIITNKEKPLTPRRKAIDGVIRSLKKTNEDIIVVHGGGSYGHYWSVKYNMQSSPKKYDIRGVSIVKNYMVELNKINLDAFLKNKLKPYSIQPTDVMIGDKPSIKKIKEIKKIANSGMIPITYGDALWCWNKKSYILSGDKIMTVLAKVLRPRLSIFVLNVDGLYEDLKTKKLISEFKNEKISVKKASMDVTGGMSRKVQEASKISKMGLKVFFVNGNKPQRIVNAIKGKKFEGTLFR